MNPGVLYLPDLDAVFLHVPKCAGTWVRRALDASGVATVPAGGPGEHNLPCAIRPEFRRAKRFCFVRHPLNWYESVWRGLHAGWPDRRTVRPLHRERSWSPIRLVTYLAGAGSFDEFVRTVVRDQAGFCSRMYEWYTGPPGSPSVDYVGRQESARADLTAILAALGWRGELVSVPAANEGAAARPEWSGADRAAVASAERVGIERWYGPDPSPFAVTVE